MSHRARDYRVPDAGAAGYFVTFRVTSSCADGEDGGGPARSRRTHASAQMGRGRRPRPEASFRLAGTSRYEGPGRSVPKSESHADDRIAVANSERSRERLTTACHEPPSEGSVDLAAALRALAGAGLPEDALRAAVEAILRAAGTATQAAPPPRLVGGA